MRTEYAPEIEEGRVRQGAFASRTGDEHGMFRVRAPSGAWLKVLVCGAKAWAAEGQPDPAWEHVSVSAQLRCPSWEEMCFVKRAFWDDDEWVVQYHPAESEYVDLMPFCLHLWRPVGVEMPKPPNACV